MRIGWIYCAALCGVLWFASVVTAQDFSATDRVCFRTVATPTVQLGCVERAAFIGVANEAFQFEGQLIFIRDTLPPLTGSVPGRRFANGDAMLVAGVEVPPGTSPLNFVAALRIPAATLPGAVNVVARAVSDNGMVSEREGSIAFAALPPPPAPTPTPTPTPNPNPPPKAPVLILMDELQGALDRAREQLAALEGN